MKDLRRLRVLHLVTTLEVGGLEQVVFHLARSGAAAGLASRVLCLTEAGPLAPRFRAAGVPVEALGGSLRRLPTVLRLARYLRRLRPHVLHTHNPVPHYFGAAASWAAGVPLLVHTKHGRNRPELPRLVFLNRLAAHLSDCVVAVSEDAAEVARRRERVPPRKLRVIHNGVDIVAFAPPRYESGSGERVIHVARLNLIKDQPTLLRAARLVADAAPAFQLDLVGDGPERGALQKLRDDLGLEGRVHFLGERGDVAALLGAADVFVLSSIGEGLSLTLLEAMASGLPVVATRVGGNAEVVVQGRTGLLVPPGSPSELADAILSLFRDPERARRMGEAGRRRVEEAFNLRRVAAAYEGLYRELLARKAAGRLSRSSPGF